jgi:hypothetical protein
MAEISTLLPQLEHLIVGRKPISIVAILVQIRRSGPLGVVIEFQRGGCPVLVEESQSTVEV